MRTGIERGTLPAGAVLLEGPLAELFNSSRSPVKQALAQLDEVLAERASTAFKAYLAGLRAGPEAVATTPPGRFLMPGDLEGSPALTFCPLPKPAKARSGSPPAA